MGQLQQQQQPVLQSNSPTSMMNLGSVLGQSAASRMMFNQNSNQPTGPPQQTLVGLPGPSPTALSNPSLSPFGQQLSQGSVTSTSASQFATNGPSLTSPASMQQQQQFNDVMKRLAPSPSSFGLQQSSVPPPTQVQNILWALKVRLC